MLKIERPGYKQERQRREKKRIQLIETKAIELEKRETKPTSLIQGNKEKK